MAKPNIDAFLAYIEKRGIHERYHALYREEVLSVLMQANARRIENLSTADLETSVKAAERMLRNRKAVCAALGEFLRVVRREGTPPLRPPRVTGSSRDDIPASARGSAAYPEPRPDEKRRFVRVPFNREVEMDGSVAPIRSSDLSLGGMYLETRQTLTPGQNVELTFKLRRNDPMPLIVRGEVVYLDPGVGVGIDFVGLPKEMEREIRYFIEDVVAGRQF
jgi:hypothetical protein